MTGRRYFGQQQVVDLLHYLRLLQNRYDDEALLTVLASPFVGVSNDALVLIRANAEKRPIFKGIERTLPPDLAEDDRRLVRAFLQRYERLVESSTRLSLELLCERILVEHDYDLAVLTRRDGQRRYANLRKLARLARSYEELRGPDIEGFIRFVAEQDAVGAPERDAVSEEEGADAVRLLTIHAAKGLEFKVVVVADAGRERSRTDEILCLSDGRFGFKVAHPSTGTRVSTTSYQAVKETQDRGRGRGAAAPLLRRDDPGDGPADRVGLGRPLERARRADADRLGAASGSGWGRSSIAPRPRARSRSSVATPPSCCGSTASTLPRPRAGRARGRAGAARRGGPARPLRGRRRGDPGPGAAAARARRDPGAAARPRGAALVQRHLAVRPLRVPLLRGAHRRHAAGAVGAADSAPMGPAVSIRPRSATPSTGCSSSSTSRARRRRVTSSSSCSSGAGTRPCRPRRSPASASSCARTPDSALAARIAALRGVRPERPFAFELDGVLVNGRLDVLWLEGERALVLDYKTNALLGRDPAEIVEEEYLTQQIVYAIACLRAGATRGRGRLPLPRGSGRGRLDGLHGRRRSAARGRAQRLDRAHPGGRVPADAERVRLLGLPGAQRRLRRAAARRRRRRVRFEPVRTPAAE